MSSFLRTGLWSFQKVLLWPKICLRKIWIWVWKQSRILRWFRKLPKTKKLYAKKCGKLELALFYITNLQKFLANNFFWVHFSLSISTDSKQRKILHIFDTHMQKKIKTKFEYCLELVECKFARHGITNWKPFFNKTFLRIWFGSFLLVNPIKMWKSLWA